MRDAIYEQIAKKYGISVCEVKQAMQAAIDAAFENPPTIEEFINYVVEQVKTL